MDTIGITGAAGSLGRRTAEYVLSGQPAADLVLLSRNPAALDDFTQAGVTTRVADFDRPDGLTTAFAGIDVLLIISSDAIGRRAEQHANAIAAAAAAGVRRVVYTSMSNPAPDHPLGVVAAEHDASEQALYAAGPSWTVLRNGLYVDTLIYQWAAATETGELVTNNGDGKHAPVTRDDCAAAAAAVLVGDGHDDVVYDITGPATLGDAEIAAALAASAGRPVQVTHLDDGEFVDALVAQGQPAAMAQILAGFGTAIRAGLLDTEVGATEELIGRPPVGLQQFLAASG